MDVIFQVNIFRIYLKTKSKFFHNCIRKKTIPKRVLLSGRDNFLMGDKPKVLHGEKIGYGDSYLDSVFRYTKVFRLHAILHDAAGAVRLQTVKNSGYRYMIGRGLNCCLLGHVTGLLLCLYVKIFLPSIFNLIDF